MHAFKVFLKIAETDHLLISWGLVPFDFGRVHGKMRCNKLTSKCMKSPDASRFPILYHAEDLKILNISSTIVNNEKKEEKEKEKIKLQHMCNLF